jgi:hypothetical protein
VGTDLSNSPAKDISAAIPVTTNFFRARLQRVEQSRTWRTISSRLGFTGDDVQLAIIDGLLAVARAQPGAKEALAPYRRAVGLVARGLLEIQPVDSERKRLRTCLAELGLERRLLNRAAWGPRGARLLAVEALGRLPSAASVRALRRLYDRASDPILRVASLDSLIELRAPPPIEQVIAQMERSPEEAAVLYGPSLAYLMQTGPQQAHALLDRGNLRSSTAQLVMDAMMASTQPR